MAQGPGEGQPWKLTREQMDALLYGGRSSPRFTQETRPHIISGASHRRANTNRYGLIFRTNPTFRKSTAFMGARSFPFINVRSCITS